jgi:catechol 2,3-dioxygenase-like lactoylglutathione lyase family enzyme
MIKRVIRITLAVREQEEALSFYTEKLGFEIRTDNPMGPGMRWLTVAPLEERGLEIVLQPLEWFNGQEREEHAARIGHNPSIVFSVDNCRATYAELASRGVEFSSVPEEMPYGVQAVARDLYGNSLVLLEPRH